MVRRKPPEIGRLLYQTNTRPEKLIVLSTVSLYRGRLATGIVNVLLQ